MSEYWHKPEPEIYLPPLGARLINPSKEKIQTPIDDRGLVDVPKLIQVVQETIHPEFRWTWPLNVHHFYWHEADYPYEKEFGTINNPSTFRELPINKGLLPKVFHNWLHLVTIPPPKPSPEVMNYRVEAWTVARSLFRNMQGSVQWERKASRRVGFLEHNPGTLDEKLNGEDIYGKAVMVDTLDTYFRGAEYHIRRLDQIPEDFRLFDPDQPRQILATQLGQLVVPRQLRSLIPVDR